MKIKLSIWKAGYLMPDTSAELKDWDISEEELNNFQLWFLKLSLWENWELIKNLDEDWLNDYLSNKYKTERLQEYPTIWEQLDMIYHDKIDWTNNWENLITEIKNKYPKN